MGTMCNAIIVNSRGDVVKCGKDTYKHDDWLCYYHSKMFRGLLSPTEYATDSIVEMGDRVVKVASGKRVLTF